MRDGSIAKRRGSRRDRWRPRVPAGVPQSAASEGRKTSPIGVANTLAITALIFLMLIGSAFVPSAAVHAAAPARASALDKPVEVIVSAAISLADVLEAARARFATAHPHIRIHFNFGSSGMLQHQIAAGAPVDLFISAAADPMDRLVEAGMVNRDAVRVLTSNTIVLIVPDDEGGAPQIEDWDDVAEPRAQRIAIGNPAHVPAGDYARSVLVSLGLWDQIQPRLVLGENVRQVLNYVRRGEVDAGIVYASDTLGVDGVRIVAEAPEGSHPTVIYPLAIPTGAPRVEAARVFADYIMSEEVWDIFAVFGFTEPPVPRT